MPKLSHLHTLYTKVIPIMSSFLSHLVRRFSSKPKPKQIAYPFLNEPHASSSLVKGSFVKLVTLPKYIDGTEWYMIHTFDFFQLTNMFYASIVDFCQQKCIESLVCGTDQQYTSIDWLGSSISLPISKNGTIPASQQIDTMLVWINHQLDQESLFPVRSDEPQNIKETLNIIKLIFTCLYRILSHIYFCHYDHVCALGEEAHLNTLFAHFMTFAIEYPSLLDKKEWQSMKPLLMHMGILNKHSE